METVGTGIVPASRCGEKRSWGGPGRTAARTAMLALACFFGLSPVGDAKINPNFTPIHLVRQSMLILQLRLGGAEKDGKLVSELVAVLKAKEGDKPKAGPSFRLADTRKEIAESFRARVKGSKGGAALLFTGEFEQEGGQGGMGGEGMPEGMLHLAGGWYTLVRGKGDVWEVLEVAEDLQGTWAGSTGMLRRCTQYVLTDPRPEVPCTSEANWADYQEVGKAPGNVFGVLAADIKGDGRACLHLLSDGGDRLYVFKKQGDAAARKAEDVTAARKLGAKSKAAAWADLNGDGRLDLASWDGKALVFWLQQEDGTFAAKDSGVKLAECAALRVVGVGDKMSAGLLASGSGPPVLVAPAGGGFVAKPIAPAADWPGAKLGRAHPCQVADFDGDLIADVLQPFERGVLLYHGKQPGAFDVPKRSQRVGMGAGYGDTCVGDFDHDGRFDVFVAAEEGCGLWRNEGKGVFAEALHVSGEVAYISKPDARSCMTCDVNNDGRQDVFITYASILPQLFFNRGFHSYGHAHMLDLQENEEDLFPKEKGAAEGDMEYSVGQYAGLVRDLDGDGAQDMVIVVEHYRRVAVQYPKKPGPWKPTTLDRTILAYWRDSEFDPLCLRVALPVGGPAGPVSVRAWSGAGKTARCLGAWNVTAGEPGAFFGQIEAGPVRVEWQFPGKKAQEKSVDVEDKARRIEIR